MKNKKDGEEMEKRWRRDGGEMEERWNGEEKSRAEEDREKVYKTTIPGQVPRLISLFASMKGLHND